jgi:TPR repeat protein
MIPFNVPNMPHRTDFLSDLILLRNDPDVALTVRAEALKGNPHAQYAMGLICAEGRGVALDNAASYAWLTLAVMQGDRDAVALRNIIGVELSDTEFELGKKLASELMQQIEMHGDIH